MDNLLIQVRTTGSNENGFLSFFETATDIPFEIKRVYYIYGVPVNHKRGMHAHKRLQQLLWCPSGTVEVILDNGYRKKSYLLDSPDKGLLVLNGHWRDLYFKEENSVLCVAASDYYDEDDYIRNYTEFQKYVEKGYWNNES